MATTSTERPLKSRSVSAQVAVIVTRLESVRWLRELLILLGFVLLTSAMTWPWVTRLRDAVADPGDPYMIAWSHWWNYHQTFHDPVHLFNANVFYPLTHTLAFSENGYGISLLFFPLFALGFRPLTINSLATFLGFAFSGYGAFRLTRTLTGSSKAGWIAGIVFGFIPYRFHLLSHLHYLFAGWLPLQLEALILFARVRSWKRAAWLGVAFTMNALSCLSWSMLAFTPMVLTTVFYVVLHQLHKDRRFWLRGGIAMSASAFVLLPFLLPYRYVSATYGLSWSKNTVQQNSSSALNWLLAENRNRLWKGLGEGLTPLGYRLFPGLLPVLLVVPAFVNPAARTTGAAEEKARSTTVKLLDWFAILSLVVTAVSIGLLGARLSPRASKLFSVHTPDRAVLVFVLTFLVRLCISYPQLLTRVTRHANLIENIRSTKNEALWIGSIWMVLGFLMSLGTNSWLFRVQYDFLFFIRAMREPSRAAMLAYVGLAVLSGIGAVKLSEALTRRWRIKEVVIIVLVAVALLFELRAAPLRFVRGAVYPDQLTLRLKQTPMRGGIVELPSGGETPHLYMLRAADHGRPLVNGSSSFVPTHSYEIGKMSRERPIPSRLLDALEQVPVSYLTIHNGLIEPDQRWAYEAFVSKAVSSGRLRFINRFDGANDLYAVVKNEPDARSEAPNPFAASSVFDLNTNPESLVAEFKEWSQTLYRIKVVINGTMPQYDEFMTDIKATISGLTSDLEGDFHRNLTTFVERAVKDPEFSHKYNSLSDRQLVEQLMLNAEWKDATNEVIEFSNDLTEGRETRASLILKIAGNPRVADIHRSRSIVLLHFFAYLRRNPSDPPDGNMKGFNYWVREVEKHGGRGEDLARSFLASGEYQRNRAR